MAIYTKITRRFFNKLITIGAAFGIGKSNKKIKTECDETDTEDYIEVLIIPKHFRHPYAPETLEVLYNHKMSGKTKAQIKEFILSQAKVIKVPIQ